MPSWKKLLVSGSDATLNSLQVTTNVTAAAFSGSFSGSFQGDGSALTGITSEIDIVKKFTSQFTLQSSVTVNHFLNSEYPFVQVYDSDNEVLVPQTVKSLGPNSIRVDFSENRSGFIVIAKGGYLVSDFTEEFTNVSTVTVNHSLGEDIPFVQVFGTDNQLFVPQTIKVLDNNTVRVDFSGNSSGYVAVSKGGYTIFDLINAGDVQAFINQDVITLNCSSFSEFPFTQVYESGSNEQIIPLGITKITPTTVQITFSSPIDGFISFPRTGHVIDNTSRLDGEPGSYYLDFNNFTNTPSFSSFPYTGSAIISGSLQVIGPVTGSTFTGSFVGDGSGLTGIVSASHAVNADTALSASFALTASYLEGYVSPFPFTGSAVISGSLEVQGTTFLSGTISASGHFVPSVNEVYDLGSPTLRWKDLYLSGSTIFLGGTKLSTNATGDIEVRDSQSDTLKKLRVDELELGTGENARKIKVDPTGAIKFMDMQGRDKTLPDLGLNNVITSSQQISFTELPGMPSGIVSSSNQINLTQTQNFITGIKSRLNVENVLSGSTQLTSSLDQRYILSGSLTQTTWQNITGKPVGIISGSHQIQLNQISGTTFSSSNYTFPQELTVLGKLTAQEFHTDLISSSIIYESGSTKFGDSLDDIHSFTGSVEVLGGITGSILATNGIVSGSSQISYTGIINVPTGIVSGSGQVKSLLPAGTISGSSQLNNTTLTGMSITGSFSGSFTGDGSQLSGIQAGINTGKSIAMAIIFGA